MRPGRDHPVGRRPGQHGADLHRAGVGAQHQRPALLLGLEVEGVHHLARRVLLRDIERAEVVEVVLDVRALGHGEAHLAEDRDDLLGDLADRVDAAVGARPHRQSDVLPLGEQLGVERRRLELALRAAIASATACLSWL